MSGSGAGRGWGTVLALSLAAALLSVVPPVLLIFVPLGLLLLAEGPEQMGPVVLGAALVATGFLGRPDGPLWYAERGWALVLGAWFVLVGAARPAARFLPRALLSVLGAALTAALALTARGGWGSIDAAVEQQFRRGAQQAVSALQQVQSGKLGTDFAAVVPQAAKLQALIYPALLGLASLAALGVAWWGVRRLVHRDAQPLSPLPEFRFRDELVWLVIAGLALVLLPLGAGAQRAGSNVLTFMGVLYAVRGAAVLLAMIGGLGPVATVVTVLLLVLLAPALAILMGAALVVGLTDTWLDFRTRRREAGGLS